MLRIRKFISNSLIAKNQKEVCQSLPRMAKNLAPLCFFYDEAYQSKLLKNQKDPETGY